MKTDFIFNGAPDSEAYVQKYESEKRQRKVHRQENYQNQFIAFRKIAEKLSVIYQKEWGDDKNPVTIDNFSDTDKLRELCKTIGPEITDDGDGPKPSSIKQPTTKEKINIIMQNINEINDKLGDIEKRLADLEQNKE